MNYSQNEHNRIPFKVDEDGELSLHCGGRIFSNYPYRQTCPLLPTSRPTRLEQIYKNSYHEERIEPCRQEVKTRYLHNDQVVAAKISTASKDEDKRNCLYIGAKGDQIYMEFKNENKIIPEELYGNENYFNGSCVRICGDKIFYTGNDGVFLTGKIEADSGTPSLSAIKQSATDDRLSFTRIYGINVLEQKDLCIPCARFKFGWSYFKSAADSLDWITSIPCPRGSIGQCYLGDCSSCMLDIDSTLILLDLQTQKFKLRKHVDCGVENYSWGMVVEGSGYNNLGIGGRKSAGLVDLRSGHVEIVKKFPEKVYLRDLVTDQQRLYATTDEDVWIYDLRNTKEVWSIPLELDYTSIVHTSSIVTMVDKTWAFSSTITGDISLSVLDFTHESCRNIVNVDQRIKVDCVRDKQPDLCGRSRLLNGWRDTVAQARLNAGVWLENAVEQRTEIEMRGLAVHHVEGGEDRAAVFLVNSVGDLFATSLLIGDNLEDPEDEADAEEEFGERLESWGRQLYKEAGLKMMYARMIVHIPLEVKTEVKFYDKKSVIRKKQRQYVYKNDKRNQNRKMSENQDLKTSKKKNNSRNNNMGLRKLTKTKVGNKRYKIKLQLSKDTRHNMGVIPNLNKVKNLSSLQDQTSRRIVRILMAKDEDGNKESGTEGESEDDQPSREKANLPEEEDPNFALKSFLADLGVAPEEQNMQNYSKMGGKD